MSTIKSNFGYNIFLTLSSYIVSFILFPYVSRVLGVENIGRIGFVNNVVSYFSLFALLGIKTLGIREIAACNNDRERRSEVFSSLCCFLLISTAIITLILVLSIVFIPRLREDKDCFIIGATILFFTSFLIEWFYQGLEYFKFITIRSVLVRVVYAISVFILVRQSSDYVLYYALTALSIIANALINFIYSRKFADISFKKIRLGKYVKSIFYLGLYGIMISMYTTFNTIYLGFVRSPIEVGYYYTATKIYLIIIGVFSAFTGVMMPRMSSLIASNNKYEFHNKIKCSFDLIFATSIPIALFFMFFSAQTISLISGSGYEGAVIPMRIIMPALVLSSMAQIWVIQALIPMKKDFIVLLGSVLGAFSGVVLNILLVERFGAVGTAIVMLLCEILGNIVGFIYAIKKDLFVFPFKHFIIYIFGSIPYLLLFYFSSDMFEDDLICIMTAMISCLIYFFIFHLFIYKGSYTTSFINNIICSSKFVK